ncbi:MAG: hypothetical protein KKC19_02810 [Nanoarchaeota archaeon]|nr:hypothetical protein [Nanoarchaeota archaeon]
MKKVILILLLVSFVFGIMINSTMVLSQGENSQGNQNSAINSEDDEANSGQERNMEQETEREFTNADGMRARIQRQVRIEDGKRIIDVTRTITDANGNKQEIKIKIEENTEGIDFEKKIIIESETGEENIIKTELEVESDFNEEESDIMVKTIDGQRHAIKVLPERVREIARERLRLREESSSNLTLEEVMRDGVPKVVYKLDSEHPGRFLGIFKTALKAETQIDPKTGEVLNVNKPWWAFLVNEEEVAFDENN